MMRTTNLLSNWRSRATLAVVAFAIVAAACSGGDAHAGGDGGDGAEVALGPAVPITTFETFEGETATLASYAGRPLVVNFWASWCPSCVAEMSAAFKPVQEAVGDEVTFIGVNIQDERDRAEELLATTGVQWISAEDPQGELYVELGGLGMPFTIFVSPSGEILDTHNGPLNEAQLLDRINELLLG
jgi:thiol-disulfide isomerase/thioredoxin